LGNCIEDWDEGEDRQIRKIELPKRPRDHLIKVEGLWVHRGIARADADWEHVIDEVRTERIASVSKR
jgi:hypothetical protein